MKYIYEHIRDNGDATGDYNIKGEFPVIFDDFFKYILKNENSFRVEFGASNECFGGWLGKRLGVKKNAVTGTCYFEDCDSKVWYEEIKHIPIIKCWANGGWGQMLYVVTFDESALTE